MKPEVGRIILVTPSLDRVHEISDDAPFRARVKGIEQCSNPECHCNGEGYGVIVVAVSGRDDGKSMIFGGNGDGCTWEYVE